MIRFDYVRPTSVAEAVRDGADEGVRYLAGGTNLIDLMKETTERPTRVVDINRLPLHDITELDGGGLRLGALAPNAETSLDTAYVENWSLWLDLKILVRTINVVLGGTGS